MQTKNQKVPFFNGYFPRIRNMSQDQLNFYHIWLEEMQKGNYLDIKGSLGYVFIYMYNLSQRGDYEKILHELLLLRKHYGEYEKVNDYCSRWIANYYITKDNYEKALEYVPSNFNVIMHVRAKVSLDEIVRIYYSKGLRNNLRNYIDEIIAEMVLMYKQFEQQNSIDTVTVCTKTLDNGKYYLFPGLPTIPSMGRDGEFDPGLQSDSIETTIYEFDLKKFEDFIPRCYGMAIEKVKTKNKSSTPVTRYDNALDKWLYEHPNRARVNTQKEIFDYEESYLYGLSKSQNPLEKHYWLDCLIHWYYTNREYPDFIEKAVKYGIQDLEIFDSCMKQFEEKNFENIPYELEGLLFHSENAEKALVNSFANNVKYLITIYEKTGHYDQALELCEQAVSIGIDDTTTKGGFKRKIEMLRKKV